MNASKWNVEPENNVHRTAILLQEHGYPITDKRLSRLCVIGEGPPSRFVDRGKKRLVEKDRVIEWQAALEWARREYPTGRKRRTKKPQPPQEYDPTQDKWHVRLIADQRIMALRDDDPETWNQIMQLPKADRLNALNRHNYREPDSTDALINIPVVFDTPRMTWT